MSSIHRRSSAVGLLLSFLSLIGAFVFRQEGLFGDIIHLGLQAVCASFAAFLLFQAYQRNGNPHWYLYGVGVLFGLAAHLCGIVLLLAKRDTAGNISLVHLLWGAQYVWFAIAIWRQNRVVRKPGVPFLFDILMFVTVALTIYWQQFVHPVTVGSGYPDGMLLYNWAFVTLSFVATVFLFVFDRSSLPKAARLMLGTAFLLLTLGSSVDWYTDLHAVSKSVDALADWCAAMGALMMGFASLAGGAASAEPEQSESGLTGIKRYMPMGLGSLLLVQLLSDTFSPSPVAFGCLAGVLLMIGRLFLVVRELQTVNVALQESNLNYRNWVDNALVGVFIEQDGRLVYVNRHCEEIFGYEPGWMVGHSMFSHIAYPDIARFAEEVDKLKVNTPTVRFSVTGVKRDHDILYLEMQLAATSYRGRDALSGTLIDITERKMSEQWLIRSEKLSVVGQLAAGVAHEIRNPLTALKGFTQLLHQNADHNRQYYEIMLAELERINYIVGEFMVLSKPHNRQQLKEHDIHRILTSIIPILESQAILHNVVIRVEPIEAMPLVKCDDNQIKQVLINLMKNAIEAMPDGGAITVRYEKDAQKRQLIVYIEDTGAGIPPELLERLGEPFLTTKEKGTGLGLMVCYKIIQAHEGILSIHSQPGQGTSVKLVLPAR